LKVKRAIVILLVVFAAAMGCRTDMYSNGGFSDPRLSNDRTIHLLTSEVAGFMKSADSVSVFRADRGKKPGEADCENQVRKIDGAARTEFVTLLADPKNYSQGLWCVVEAPATTSFGFKLKNGKLFLVCDGGGVDGEFRGRKLYSLLKANALFVKWRQTHEPKK
jgi:hypothetical protein